MKFLFLLILSLFIPCLCRAQATPMTGFPISMDPPQNVFSTRPINFADLDSDGEPEFLFYFHTGLKALNQDGTSMLGFNPSTFAPTTLVRIRPILADTTGDGNLEILQLFPNGDLCLYDRFGYNMPGWPKLNEPLNSKFQDATFGDLDGDGKYEIIASKGVPGYVEAFHADGSTVEGWPMFPEWAQGVL